MFDYYNIEKKSYDIFVKRYLKKTCSRKQSFFKFDNYIPDYII